MNLYHLSDNSTLDNYILAKELTRLAGISPNAYRYWKRCVVGRYDKSRVLYLHKNFIHKKYSHLIPKCTPLDGLIQSAPFCRWTNLPSSHLTKSNRSSIYHLLGVRFVEGIKFVDLRAFLERFGLDYNYTIYIEKCKYFAPLEKKIQLSKSLCLGYY